ncbi:MAG: VWA domain-containing protein, partial [Planctomycetes bacterium]|nr:VWA domain-containing protein [Planctomycetota bacterium]
MTHREEGFFGQWESSSRILDRPLFARFSPAAPPPFEIPLIQTIAPQNIRALRMSEWNESQYQDKTRPLLLIYDRLPGEVGPRFVRPLTENHNPLSVILDCSGSMARPVESAKGPSSLSIALSFLIEKRATRTDPWQLYSFSESFTHLGSWSVDGDAILARLPSPSGKTRFLGVLEELSRSPREAPRDIVFLSDGLSTERDFHSVELALGRLRSRGDRIFLIGPRGEPIPAFEEAYRKGLIAGSWPEQEPEPLPGQTWVLSSGEKIPWRGIFHNSGGEDLLPLLFSEDGLACLYHQREGDRDIFHMIGEPEGDPVKRLEHIFSH